MKAGFIGVGHMGAILAGAAAKAEKSICVADFSAERAQEVAGQIGATSLNNEKCAESEYVFFGVKPDRLEAVAGSVAEIMRKNGGVAVSMAAGVKIEKILKILGADAPVIRIMPNTPASVGCGMILYSTANVDGRQEEEFLRLLAECGEIKKIDERVMDAACALSGCGPAFFYFFASALARGAQECGLSKEEANVLAYQTMLGSAKMMKETGKEADALVREVCSPGGSTIEGVHVLENSDFCKICADCVKASFEKNKLLGK